MTNPPLINLRIAPYVKAGHPKVGAIFIIEKVRAFIKICSCRFTRTPFLCACPGVSPQRRLAQPFGVIAKSYPVRTAIQLSRIAESECPPSSLDKGVSKYNPVVKKVSFVQVRNVPLTITTGKEKSICAKDFPSTFQVVIDFRFLYEGFCLFTPPLLYWHGIIKNWRNFFAENGENSTVWVNAKLPKALIFQGFSTREVPSEIYAK